VFWPQSHTFHPPVATILTATQSRHRARRSPVYQSAIAKLALIVGAPRPQRAIALHGHRVEGAGGNTRNFFKTIHGCPTISSRNASVTELPARVVSPGPYPALLGKNQDVPTDFWYCQSARTGDR